MIQGKKKNRFLLLLIFSDYVVVIKLDNVGLHHNDWMSFALL